MKYKSIYFIGIGGIGMSNLARYFLSKGMPVAGYDRTETALTKALEAEGANIHYVDDIEVVPQAFLNKHDTLIIYTPAIPETNNELTYFKNAGFKLMKRSQVLGEITKSGNAICVAGTHGKTTVSSMTAHLLRQSHVDCNAFLGGILKNYDSNLLLSDKSPIMVVEADEYDRSFHWLEPWIAIITSADPDHLDIYGTPKAYRESFEKFSSLIRENGYVIIKKDIPLTPRCRKSVKMFTYSASQGDFHAENIRVGNGEIFFDMVTPDTTIRDIQLGVPMKVNIENAVAAIAAATIGGVSADEIKSGMKSFAGAKRRFDFQIKTSDMVLLDDYAHHPKELSASIESIKMLYPDKKISGIFQPHLYTRTRDFADEFAQSLSLLDEVILLDIYPAREKPIEGVSSEIIFEKISSPQKKLLKKEELIDYIRNKNFDVLVTLGAGDIDTLLPEIKKTVENSLKTKPE